MRCTCLQAGRCKRSSTGCTTLLAASHSAISPRTKKTKRNKLVVFGKKYKASLSFFYETQSEEAELSRLTYIVEKFLVSYTKYVDNDIYIVLFTLSELKFTSVQVLHYLFEGRVIDMRDRYDSLRALRFKHTNLEHGPVFLT